MPAEVLALIPQLGIAGVLFWLLWDERKQRAGLEDRVFKYLDDRLDQIEAKTSGTAESPESLRFRG